MASAIYLAKEYNNARNILFFMDKTDFRVAKQDSNYMFVTDALPIGGTKQPCPKTGAAIELMSGRNGKTYIRYTEDYSMREVTDEDDLMKLMYPNK